MNHFLFFLFCSICSFSFCQEEYSVDTLFNDDGTILSIEDTKTDYNQVFSYDDSANLVKYQIVTRKNDIQYEMVKEYYSDGQIKEEYYYYVVNKVFYGKSELDSLYAEYHNNGQPKYKCFYKNDELNGQYTVFKSNGDIESVKEYKKGKLLNATYFDNSGNILPNNSFKDGNGELIIYQDGSACKICRFKNGKLKKCRKI